MGFHKFQPRQVRCCTRRSSSRRSSHRGRSTTLHGNSKDCKRSIDGGRCSTDVSRIFLLHYMSVDFVRFGMENILQWPSPNRQESSETIHLFVPMERRWSRGKKGKLSPVMWPVWTRFVRVLSTGERINLASQLTKNTKPWRLDIPSVQLALKLMRLGWSLLYFECEE